MFALTVVVGVANIIYIVLQAEWKVSELLFCVLQYITMLMLLTLPIILQRRFLINIPLVLIVAIVIFAFVSMVMGDGLNFYGRYPWWDSGLHLLSGIVLGFIGLWILHIMFADTASSILANRYFVALYLLLFGLACGAVWEIVEYTFDDLFGTNTQQFMLTTTASIIHEGDLPLSGHDALRDTMTDLTLDFLGSLLVAAYVFFNHKRLLERREELQGSLQ